MTKKQTKSTKVTGTEPDYDIEQAFEAQRIAETRPDSRWPLASVPNRFLRDIAIGNLDLPDEGGEALDAIEVTAQLSVDLHALAYLELVRRDFSAKRGELIHMSRALDILAEAYLTTQTTPRA